jgi:hypothetical protein
MQGLGGALTYMRRYAWAAVLGISDEEDDDGNQASTPAAQTPAAAQRAQETQPRANGASTISEAQQKRLFAIAKSNGVDAATVKRLTQEIAGVDTSAQVPKAKYDELVAAVETAGGACSECGGVGGAHSEACPESVPFMPTVDGLGG